MKRTTIMANPETIAQLKRIAEQEGRSLAEVVREALEDRVRRPRPRLHFLGVAVSSPGTGPTARESAEVTPEPRPWR